MVSCDGDYDEHVEFRIADEEVVMRPRHQLLSLSIALALAAASAGTLASTGTVTNLSGTLSVKKADGSVRILSQKSQIESGDTLNTERESFAQIKFSDGAQLTLKPNTAVKIESF